MNFCQNKIELKDITKNYGNNLILNKININLSEGELVTILGPSGCGKSTIFNIITNLEDIDKGSIEVNGKISYMYQKDLLLPYKNIIDNVSLPLVLNGTSKSKAREYVKEYFDIFDISGSEYSFPNELSGGMKQRANFLRTYICSNDIMLLDEPFGALDSITKKNMQDWLLSLRKKLNTTILMITHDVDEAIYISDRIYILSNKPANIKKEIVLKNNIDKNSLEDLTKTKKEIIDLL